jgi:pimeloyl-ACP methyl ester carboxylesterase
MKPPRDRSIDARGLKIHYLEWGEPQGEPLVLIHGFLDHAGSWAPFVGALTKKTAAPKWIIAPDCRGHGDSGWVGAGGYYHFADYLWDLDRVVESLGIAKMTLLGHSMGGTISFLYSGTYPERIRKLILVEGIGPQPMSFGDAPPRMARWLADMQPELALQLARSAAKKNSSGKWVWKFDPLHRTAAPQPFYSGQAVEFFRRIACPVLLVHGTESRQTRRPDMEERLAAIARRSFAEIEKAGHMIHHDNPERLAEVVTEFLAR